MRKGKLCAAAIALLPIIVSASPASAIPLPTPTLLVGQKDGVFITNGRTIVEYQTLVEFNDGFFSREFFNAPAAFKPATVFLTEPGHLTCTPQPLLLSLGDCSDGITLQTDLSNPHMLDVSFVSADGNVQQRTNFFNGIPHEFKGVQKTIDFVPETGLWQDISVFFHESAGFAWVQSSIDPTPEPVTGLLFGTGLAALAVFRRRGRRNSA